jgi:hypothetical protein
MALGQPLALPPTRQNLRPIILLGGPDVPHRRPDVRMPHVVLEFDYIAAEQLGRVRGAGMAPIPAPE